MSKRRVLGEMMGGMDEADPFEPKTPEQKKNRETIQAIRSQASWWIHEYPKWIRGVQGVSGQMIKKLCDPIHEAYKKFWQDKWYGKNYGKGG